MRLCKFDNCRGRIRTFDLLFQRQPCYHCTTRHRAKVFQRRGHSRAVKDEPILSQRRPFVNGDTAVPQPPAAAASALRRVRLSGNSIRCRDLRGATQGGRRSPVRHDAMAAI